MSAEGAGAADRRLAPGLTTWPSLAALDGDVLVIINSPAGDEQAVSNLFDAIAPRVPAARLHVIAMPGWQRWLRDRGGADVRVLFSADAAGRELELNSFLESRDALGWILARRFAVIVGSAPHSLYNEEVKDTFEQRVAIVLRTGRFLAHALPAPYLYVLDLAGLLQRFGRARKSADYRAVCRAIIDDLHQMWTAAGKPRLSDGSPFVDTTRVLARHLGEAVLSWDEASPIPRRSPDPAEPAAEFVTYLATVLAQLTAAPDVGARDAIIAELQAGHAREVEKRDGMLAELDALRAREVGTRDATIAELHAGHAREVEKRDGMLAELDALRAREGAREATIDELRREHAGQARELEKRDSMLAELDALRAREVGTRDATIAELRRDLAFATRGWRRWMVGRPPKTS